MTLIEAYEKGYDTVIDNLKTNLKGMETNLRYEKNWLIKYKIKTEMRMLNLIIELTLSLKEDFIEEFKKELFDNN